MGSPIPRSRPDLPDEITYNTQRPVYASQLAAFADVANYLGGWRFLRLVTKHWDYPSAPDLGLAGVGVAATISTTYRVRLHTSPDVTALVVVFTYWAANTGSSAQVTVTLDDPQLPGAGAPTVRDAGCIISKANGGLRVARWAGEYAVPETATTGFNARPGIYTNTLQPRPLNTPAASVNADQIVNLTTVSCRIYSATVWELYDSER